MTDPNYLGELGTVSRVLDQYCEVIVWELRGLDETAAHHAGVPSGTSPLGIVRHMGPSVNGSRRSSPVVMCSCHSMTKTRMAIGCSKKPIPLRR